MEAMENEHRFLLKNLRDMNVAEDDGICMTCPQTHFFLLFLPNIHYNKLVSQKMNLVIITHPVKSARGSQCKTVFVLF